MTDNKKYIGIDYFRLIAALLIVAIHTSPFSDFTKTGDFIFTRIIARVAVPFFFVTSGFFLIAKYSYNSEKLWLFVKKTVIIYISAIIIYIPINIYNNYFQMDNFMPNFIKDIVFDGTLYHLWYLPASVAGSIIAWYAVKKFSYKKAFIITSILYITGLLGDSYYGISKNISCLKNFYNLIFQVMDYTRNGIFFAPIFFVLGGYIADNKNKISIRKYFIGFLISFTFMLTEALILRCLDWQRHDSMYLFLIPTIYCLFSILLCFKGKRSKILRTVSLIVYIIHPFVIVLIRLFAKVIHLESLLVENSFIHYILVCVVSVLMGIIFYILLCIFKPEKRKYNTAIDRSYLEIDLNNLENNVKVLQNEMSSKSKIMAVVKAQAYGHGMYEVTTFLEKIGICSFAVATIDEGIKLRRYGISGEILILGYTAPDRAKELHKYKLTQTLIDYGYALSLNKQGYDIKAHIKIDTGMHRLGFDVEDTKSVSKAFLMKYIKITGIFTHLCVADSLKSEDIKFSHNQIESFYNLINKLKSMGIDIPKVHIQSSYGLLNYPELECDYVRVGIALYGVLSSCDDKTKLSPDLKPVLSLKTRVILLRKIKKGDSVGYGRDFVAERDSIIAILPIGYADGFPRSLYCKNSYVLIEGQKAYVVGRICMDQLAVDVTDILGVKIGSVATIIGRDGKEEITAKMVAKNMDSITNELLSRMGQRLKVVYKS